MENKAKYQTPEIEVIEIDAAQPLLVSGETTPTGPGFGGETSEFE